MAKDLWTIRIEDLADNDKFIVGCNICGHSGTLTAAQIRNLVDDREIPRGGAVSFHTRLLHITHKLRCSVCSPGSQRKARGDFFITHYSEKLAAVPEPAVSAVGARQLPLCDIAHRVSLLNSGPGRIPIMNGRPKIFEPIP